MNTTLKVVLGITGLIAIPVVAGVYSTFSSLVTAPSRVINRTLNTDNIISSYEWYHDANAQINARVAQINKNIFMGTSVPPKDVHNAEYSFFDVE